MWTPIVNAFCATGEGGGIDPSCSSGGSGEGFSKGLNNEVEYLLDSSEEMIEDDFGGDRGAARKEIIKELIQDMDEPDHPAGEFKKELEDYGVKVGVFREITKDEMARTVVISRSRGKKYDFKRGGKFYVFKDWKPLE